MANEYKPWVERGETELEWLRREYLKQANLHAQAETVLERVRDDALAAEAAKQPPNMVYPDIRCLPCLVGKWAIGRYRRTLLEGLQEEPK